jgi:hypothetical protein
MDQGIRILEPSKQYKGTLRFEESKPFCEPQSNCLARALLGEDNFSETIAILEPIYKANDTTVGLGALGNAYARVGRREDAEKLAAAVRRPLEKAQVYAGLGAPALRKAHS